MTERYHPTEREREAARAVAQEAYDNGHRWTVEQLNLLSRTIGAKLVERQRERDAA